MTARGLTREILAFAFGLALAFAWTGFSQTISQDDLRFREAVHKEQVEGDLNTAIKLLSSHRRHKQSDSGREGFGEPWPVLREAG